MNKPHKSLWILTLVLTSVLVGCNLPRRDTAAVQTAAALTVQAALTAAAPSATITAAPAQMPATPGVPSVTPQPAQPAATSCDKAQFVGETVPDNTLYEGVRIS